MACEVFRDLSKCGTVSLYYCKYGIYYRCSMQGADRLSMYKNILFVTSGKYSKISVPVHTESMSMGKTCRVLLQCESLRKTKEWEETEKKLQSVPYGILPFTNWRKEDPGHEKWGGPVISWACISSLGGWLKWGQRNVTLGVTVAVGANQPWAFFFVVAIVLDYSHCSAVCLNVIF